VELYANGIDGGAPAQQEMTFAPGEPVRDNAQLVERAARLAELSGRPPMSSDDARHLLNVRDRRGEGVA